MAVDRLNGNVVQKCGKLHRPQESASAGITKAWVISLTVVYQIDHHCKRLLWVGQDRTRKTLLGFFRQFGKERSAQLAFICSDMWKPYLAVVAKKASQALHILDRFHIVMHMNKAIDKVRAQEARELKANGRDPILKHSRWCLLKRPENLTEIQNRKLSDLVRHNLKAVRSYLLKEDFQPSERLKSLSTILSAH